MNPETPDTADQPSDRDTAILARQIWEDEGRPEGKAEEHWARAQIQLQRMALEETKAE